MIIKQLEGGKLIVRSMFIQFPFNFQLVFK